MKRIILLSGEKRSGKDTVGEMIFDILRSAGQNPVKTAFGNKLKEASAALVNIIYGTNVFTVDQFSDEAVRQGDYPFAKHMWNGKQICLRTVLQQFGTEVCRTHIDPDIWVNAVIKFIRGVDNDTVIITDARFPNEIDMIVTAFPNAEIMSILIKRPGLNHADTHASESFFAQMEKDGMYSNVIMNDEDLAGLRRKVVGLF